ncbi:hypothetical protein EAF04_005992 [Stromatinia cepivora]|nr:hypothetical protein EAF04_005992 [Stromatinia cepivora]
MTPLSHVRESVRQIDETSWLVGGKHIIRQIEKPDEGVHLSYKLSEAPATLPDSVSIPPGSHVRQIHDAGDASAVFSFGDVLILKVKNIHKDQPQEDETLAFLAKQKLSFEIPHVLFCAKDEERIYLLEPRMPGERLNEAWWNMSEAKKEHVVTRVAEICLELKNFQACSMTGIDFNWMDPLREPGQRDYRPESLQKHCETLGMDCSTFVLSHNDLGPTNILINGDRITVIDWELAGYCPLAWVRTKFAICGALDVSRVVNGMLEIDGEYRVRVEKKLEGMGFPEVTEAYNKMH